MIGSSRRREPQRDLALSAPQVEAEARRFRRARRVSGLVAIVLVAVVIPLIVVDPFSGRASSGGAIIDNGAPTALATVLRRSLSSQTQVSGTLGYANNWTVSVPSGTPPANAQQAHQALTAARAALEGAAATLSADEKALAEERAQRTADHLKERSDCAGDNAAGGSSGGSGSGAGGSGGVGSSGGGGSNRGGGGSGSDPCAAAAQAAASDQAGVVSAQQKVAGDQGQLASARSAVSAAQQTLDSAAASATGYGATATYTMLPVLGAVVRRGQPLYAINGRPTLLLYGPVAAWRAFRPGMSQGRDVAELNANLRALGFGDPAGDSFTTATAQAIEALQANHRLAGTGTLPLGSVVFEPGPLRVTTVTPTSGQTVQPGAVLTASSMRHQVAIQLDAAQQGQIELGDKVTVTLPDNATTPGVVDKVGKVAVMPSSSDQGNGGGSSTPTIEVDVRLMRAGAAGSLDQAPVQVSITTASVHNVLVVPVNALVALAGGGYAVEEVEAGGVHRLMAVTPGLFDDAEGLVQVSGTGLAAGERVVVPAS